MLISSAFRKSWQLELLFADFFASITLTIISLRIALRPMWVAWLLVLLGMIATDQSYRSIKVALKGLEVWELQQTCAVWGFLLAVCMAFVTPSELEPDVWSFTHIARASLLWLPIVPYVMVQVALVRVFGRRFFDKRHAELARRAAEEVEQARKKSRLESAACKAILVKAKSRTG